MPSSIAHESTTVNVQSPFNGDPIRSLNEEPFDGKGFNWPAEHEFSGGAESVTFPGVLLPEDSEWYFDWALTPDKSSFD